MNNSSLSTFKNIAAAMPFYYAARNSADTPVTKLPYIKLLLDGAVRAAAKRRGSVKKADTLSEESIRIILTSTLWPSGSESCPHPSLQDWRTATKLFTFYKTMCIYGSQIFYLFIFYS